MLAAFEGNNESEAQAAATDGVCQFPIDFRKFDYCNK